MGESNVVKKQAAVVDIFKFLFSICILVLHTKIVHNFPIKSQWYITHLIFRLGVPFFFCTSGYFLGCKLWSDTNSDDVFEKYIRKMILPFLVWGGIGLIQYAIQLYRGDIRGYKLIWRAVQTAIFYPRGAMWFVGACIIAAFIIKCLWKNKYREFIIWGIGITGYAFALCCNTYYFLIEGTIFQKIVDKYLEICISARNGIFVGILFLWIGIVMARWIKNKEEMIDYKLVIICIICFLFYLIEVSYTYGKHVADDSALFIMHVFLLPILIALMLKYDINYTSFIRELRGLSMCIYFTHRCFINIVRPWVKNEIELFCAVLVL